MNIFPANFSGNFGLGGRFVADETKDSIGRVLRELAEELELDDGFVLLVMSLVHEAGQERTPTPREAPVTK